MHFDLLDSYNDRHYLDFVMSTVIKTIQEDEQMVDSNGFITKMNKKLSVEK